MLVHLAMTLSTVHGWSLPEPVDDKASSLLWRESAITGGVDGSRDRRQLAPPGCFSCDESCDENTRGHHSCNLGCDAILKQSCDEFGYNLDDDGFEASWTLDEWMPLKGVDHALRRPPRPGNR